jgi:hypothetical protein
MLLLSNIECSQSSTAKVFQAWSEESINTCNSLNCTSSCSQSYCNSLCGLCRHGLRRARPTAATAVAANGNTHYFLFYGCCVSSAHSLPTYVDSCQHPFLLVLLNVQAWSEESTNTCNILTCTPPVAVASHTIMLLFKMCVQGWAEESGANRGYCRDCNWQHPLLLVFSWCVSHTKV